MTCWATCCLSQRELLILHVHHICASVRLVRMEWLWRVFNEGRETPVYFRCSVESCHHCLLPDARLQMAETFDHCCSEPHLWRASSGKPRIQPVPAILARLHIRVSGKVCSRPAGYSGAALCASFTLHLSLHQNLTFAVNSVHSSFDRLFLFHRSLTNNKNLKQYTAGAVTERHHSEEIIAFFSQKEELKTVVENHMTTYSYKSYHHHGGGHGGVM